MPESGSWELEPDERGELAIGCPKCFRQVRVLPYRGTVWGFCERCGIYWFAGLFDGEVVTTLTPLAVEAIFAANQRIDPPGLDDG